ncbi:MAG: non-ribosomal peptide synthetase [Pseudomonadota bacterium]
MRPFATLTEMLAAVRDDDRGVRFVDGEDDTARLTFAELEARALTLLGALQAQGLSAGDELVIFTRDNQQFVTAFWAAVLGGLVPVPVAVGISDEHRHKLLRIVGQLERGRLVADAAHLARVRETADADDALLSERLTSALEFEGLANAEPGTVHKANPEDVAFIQYSSGSTGDPKGVCLTHANLCTNIRAIVARTGWGPEERSLSWMPLTHDMGLIGFHLAVMAAGMEHAVMDTQLFVRRPLAWIREASALRATQLCSPNFGYKHFLNVFERKGLEPAPDLSSVRLVMNGAEPISYALCQRFLEAMAPFGLAASAMYPVYGLAEATVGVALSRPGTGCRRITVDRHALRVGAPASLVAAGSPDAIDFVPVGTAIDDTALRIIDGDGAPLPEGHVGHIQVQGGAVTRQIYGDDAATAALITEDGWLRTGDCGAFVGGELIVTGRQKELVIINGQNYFPHDLEEIVAHCDGLDLGKVVVAGAPPETGDSEALLVFVLHRGDSEVFAGIAERVRRELATQVGLEVDHVLPVARIPKTTSGKIQRGALVGNYLAGAFDDIIASQRGGVSETGDALVDTLVMIANQFSGDCRIGPEDNLFEVGVSSLTLSEIVLAIDEKYPGKLDIGDLFDAPTVTEIAAFLRGKGV